MCNLILLQMDINIAPLFLPTLHSSSSHNLHLYGNFVNIELLRGNIYFWIKFMVLFIFAKQLRKLTKTLLRRRNYVFVLCAVWNGAKLFLFLWFRDLLRLSLVRNELTEIPKEALSILKNLNQLNLSENKITSIPPKSFVGEYCCCYDTHSC